MPGELWSQRGVAIAGASSDAALLVRAKDVVAIHPATGEPLGARFADARTPWPFLRGDEVWRSQKTGLAITDLRGKRARTLAAPKIAGGKPIPLTSTPDAYHGAHAGERVLYAIDVRRTPHVVACSLSDGEELWRSVIATPGTIRGLWALDTCAVALVDDGKTRESFVCLGPDGSETGRVSVPKQHGVRIAVGWGDGLLLTSEDGTSHERLDVAHAKRVPLDLPAESVVRVVGEGAYALHGQSLERLGPKPGRVEVFPPSDYPHAVFSPLFLVGDRLGLVRATAPERVQVHWVKRDRLTLAGVSAELTTETRIGRGHAAGAILLLADGRNVSALET